MTHENLCPNCNTYRKVARDYAEFNKRLTAQCSTQAAQIKELRRRLGLVKKSVDGIELDR